MKEGTRDLFGILVLGAIACGGRGAGDVTETAAQTSGLVREVECDGDRASLVLDHPSPAEPLEVAIAEDATVGGEPLAPGCEGLGRTLGTVVEVVGGIAADGTWTADRIDPA